MRVETKRVMGVAFEMTCAAMQIKESGPIVALQNLL
jgi:hypothetical protein